MIAPQTWQLGASPRSTNSFSASAEWYKPRSTREGEPLAVSSWPLANPPCGGVVSLLVWLNADCCTAFANGQRLSAHGCSHRWQHHVLEQRILPAGDEPQFQPAEDVVH